MGSQPACTETLERPREAEHRAAQAGPLGDACATHTIAGRASAAQLKHDAVSAEHNSAWNATDTLHPCYCPVE